MDEEVIDQMVDLVVENLIWMNQQGQWTGSPESLTELSVSFLYNLKAICELAISIKGEQE